MENIIKSGEEIRSKALENARRLYEEYQVCVVSGAALHPTI